MMQNLPSRGYRRNLSPEQLLQEIRKKGELHYYNVLPLEEITLRTIVTCLWNGSIFDTNGRLRDVWHIFEADVKGKVSNFNIWNRRLPQELENGMMNLIEPIGSDILNWQVYHENNFVNEGEVFNFHILQHLQRSCRVLIDYRRTADVLVDLEIFAANKCFELACFYCLEDIVPCLWDRFSEEDKESFLRNVSVFYWKKEWIYWACILTNGGLFQDLLLPGGIRLSFTFSNALRNTASIGNKSATQYFFQRLTQEEQVSDLISSIANGVTVPRFGIRRATILAISNEKVSDGLCYLLSVMTPEQVRTVLNRGACRLLSCLLYLQLESIFLDIADLCWMVIKVRNYEDVLYFIHKDIREKGYYIRNLFRCFFQFSPLKFRIHFVRYECRENQCRSIFFVFLRAEDTELIKIIFKNIDASDRRDLVFSERGCQLLNSFILSGRWRVVAVCLREATLSNEDMVTMEERLKNLEVNLFREIPNEWRRRRLQSFSNFLRDPESYPPPNERA